MHVMLARESRHSENECIYSHIDGVMNTYLANAVAIVRATHFGANPETLASNAFQAAASNENATTEALKEQIALATVLEDVGVDVLWLEPPAQSVSPDGVFPNNWFSTHDDATLVIYPMEAPSRRSERLPDLADRLRVCGYRIDTVTDWSDFANHARYLEGTGSLVLDRMNRVAYACPSTRTETALAEEWAARFGYVLQWFKAADPDGRAVYHTNVVMSLGAGLAIVCFDAMPDEDQRATRKRLEETGQAILEIDWQQVKAFAGNQLFLQGRDGPVVALSRTADRALRPAQKTLIDRYAKRVAVDIATIERHGGGSVRCMLAEIFLPRR